MRPYAAKCFDVTLFRMTRINLVIALALLALPAFAQRGESAKPPADASATPAAAKSPEPKSAEPMKNPLPADKSVPQTITVNGKTLHYTATVGTITLKSKDDKPNGVVDVHGIHAGSNQKATRQKAKTPLRIGPSRSRSMVGRGRRPSI